MTSPVPDDPYRAPAPDDDGRHDFDFAFGRWRMPNRRLRKRLEDNHDWDEFVSFCECHPILGGLGNIDKFTVERFVDGKPLEGMTLRLFDPATRLWSIYWADDRRFKLDPPVIGRFDGDRGVFEGADTLAGRPIIMRFTWTRGARPAWEQAFSPDGGKSWETNWYNSLEPA
jgi:hypothetical protein